jgi:hypothetical protein
LMGNGTCTNTLGSGQSCQPTCKHGVPSGPILCGDGQLQLPTCHMVEHNMFGWAYVKNGGDTCDKQCIRWSTKLKDGFDENDVDVINRATVFNDLCDALYQNGPKLLRSKDCPRGRRRLRQSRN